MLYLRTGGNGSGKTLLTLEDVRKLQVETGRPVCYNIRPADHPDKPNTPYCNLKPEKIAEFGWTPIHFKDWEKQADGTIFLVDECHYDLPTRSSRDAPPSHIARLTEHRSRGFDFFLLTQHPKNIDSFVRNLVQPPGFHQHIKRLGGALPVANVCQWEAVNLQCEQMGSGRSGEVKTRPYPKHVYDWYNSATIHTGKTRIPKKVWVLLACVVVVPVLIWKAMSSMPGIEDKEAKSKAGSSTSLSRSNGGTSRAALQSKTTDEYLAAQRPRIEGLRHSALAYDELTRPTRVPVPAACVSMGERCKCYTQDATSYTTTAAICKQIVENGLWLEFQPEGQQGQRAGSERPLAGPSGGAHQAPQAEGAAGAPGLVVFADTPKSSGRPEPKVETAVAQPRVPASSPWSFQIGQ